MNDYRIDIGFDLEGCKKDDETIYLPCAAVNLSDEPPAVTSHFRFRQGDTVRFQVYDITGFVTQKISQDQFPKDPWEPSSLKVLFKAGRQNGPESPLDSRQLDLTEFTLAPGGSDVTFDTDATAWVAKDANGREEFKIERSGAFLVTYELQCGSPIAVHGEPLLVRFKHDPEWIVGGGTGPGIPCVG